MDAEVQRRIKRLENAVAVLLEALLVQSDPELFFDRTRKDLWAIHDELKEEGD